MSESSLWVSQANLPAVNCKSCRIVKASGDSHSCSQSPGYLSRTTQFLSPPQFYRWIAQSQEQPRTDSRHFL